MFLPLSRFYFCTIVCMKHFSLSTWTHLLGSFALTTCCAALLIAALVVFFMGDTKPKCEYMQFHTACKPVCCNSRNAEFWCQTLSVSLCCRETQGMVILISMSDSEAPAVQELPSRRHVGRQAKSISLTRLYLLSTWFMGYFLNSKCRIKKQLPVS